LQDLGPGLPLDASNRALMEARFGTNFGHVRVHTDAQAAESARMMNAKAFTLGQDIVFGTGQYALETITGKRLLAHELTHVIQQRVGNNQIIQRQPDGSDSADTWKPVDDSIMQVWIHAEIEEAGGETQVEKLKNAWYDTLRKRKENPKDLNYVALEHYMHVRGSVAEGGYLKYAGFRLATPAYEILKAGIGEKSSQELRTDENDEVSPASYDVFKWGMIAAQDGLWDYRKGGSSYCCRWSSAAQP